MKKFRNWLLIALTIESVTYYWKLHQHVESFFFVWGALFLGVFLIELFSIDTSKLGLMKYQLLKAKNKHVHNENIKMEQESSELISVRLGALGVMVILNIAIFLIMIPR